MILSIIVAAAENNIIGRNNELIWHISADLKRFKQLTTHHTILMGRKTFQSIGRALPNRRNLVISRNPDFQAPGCEIVRSIPEALEQTKSEEEIFIIGGGSIYRELWDRADRLYLTRIHACVEGDTSIPGVSPLQWELTEQENGLQDETSGYTYSFLTYCKKN